MKKLLLSSIILFLFSASIMMFQVSCQKDANAKINELTQQNKIVYTKTDNVGKVSIWLANTDGTNKTKVPITLPVGYVIRNTATITPDGSKILFPVEAPGGGAIDIDYIYSCSTDGSNLQQIVGDGTESEIYSVHAY